MAGKTVLLGYLSDGFVPESVRCMEIGRAEAHGGRLITT